jgi:hypothetical protein
MKPKQLANVLIKVLGLSVLLHGLPSFATGFVRGFLSTFGSSTTTRASTSAGAAPLIVGGLVELVLAVVLVVKSRPISDFLFRKEDE